ncbi:hypothetical protein CC86DRAFT_327439 [Ophiobolus disseminans]|uniref:Cytochrome P450 n=1 Tax=Ophiobolus disseminans TaxID=1469910 RepID=A0A6A6ZT78_9PLEO|nr:hypothetical protein CC86DRAFT_327439 [Ophiobolus disseminans]
MGSLRTLFLGVYASNALIRVLFLPLCYVLLLSPFLTVAAYFLGFGKTLRAYVPEDFSWTDLLPQIVLATVFLLLPTRLLSGSGNASKADNGRKRRVQSLPYWIPGFRHFWSITLGGEKWLKGVRDSTIDSIVAYNAFGAKHYVVLTETSKDDSLLTQVFKNASSLQVPRSSKWATMSYAYSTPSKTTDRFFELEKTIDDSIRAEVYKEATQHLTSATINILSETLPDFITFNSSIVDQMQWERVADVELTDGTTEAECNFFALINEFCCNASLAPLLGAQVTESYQLLATDLTSFNQRYWALALGLPRLSPIQGLPGAALAQKRLIQNLSNLFRELTDPPVRRVLDDDESVSGEETDADVLTPIAKLNDLFTQHDLAMAARAAIALQVIHEIVAEVVPLVFWTLTQVASSSSTSEIKDQSTTPLEIIKQETTQWAQAYQPPSIHPAFPSPPAIAFTSSPDGIKPNAFPYLRSCINEARRLYGTPMATYQVTKPFTIQEPSVRSNEQDLWEIEVGSYIDIGLSQSLINSSPTIFPDPATFRPDRFISQASPPSSITSPNDKTEPYKTSLVISIVAGILQMWEISPAPKKSFFEHMQEAREEVSIGAATLTGEEKAAKSSQDKERRDKEKKDTKWVLPKAVEGSFVRVPKGDVRVRIRRREGLPKRDVFRR